MHSLLKWLRHEILLHDRYQWFESSEQSVGRSARYNYVDGDGFKYNPIRLANYYFNSKVFVNLLFFAEAPVAFSVRMHTLQPFCQHSKDSKNFSKPIGKLLCLVTVVHAANL